MSKLFTLILVILAIFSPFGAQAQAKTPGAGPVKIGVILPLSGDSASIGISIRNGIELALEKIPEDARSKIHLIFEDDQFSPPRTLSAFQKLTSVDRIDFLITAYSGQSKAVAPLSEQKRIPQLAIASDPEIVRERNYVVNFWVTPEEESRVAIEEALRRGYRRIARISAIQQGFVAIRSGFDVQNKGRLIIGPDEEYNPDIHDFRTFLSKVKDRRDIDAICVLLMVNGQIGVFAKQVREMGLKLPLFNIEGFEDANEQKIAQGALTGHWYVINDDPSGEFTESYQKRFPGASLFAAGNGHDALLLYAAALAKNPQPEAVNQFLR